MHTDGNFGIWGRRNFHRALNLLLVCVGTVGRWCRDVDRTMDIPYEVVTTGGNGGEGRVGGEVIGTGGGRGWKFLATDLIWIMASVGKYKD